MIYENIPQLVYKIYHNSAVLYKKCMLILIYNLNTSFYRNVAKMKFKGLLYLKYEDVPYMKIFHNLFMEL